MLKTLWNKYLTWRRAEGIAAVTDEVTPQVHKADISERDLLKQSRGLAKTGEGGSF